MFGVVIRVLDPDKGDMLNELLLDEAVELVLEHREKGISRFGIWEGSDEQLELEMMTRTGILDALREKEGDVLRLVPIVGGG